MGPETSPAHPTKTFSTWRRDAWWVEPLVMVVFLLGFVAYSTWRVFEMATDPVIAHGKYHYMSPLVAMDFTFLMKDSWVQTVPYLAYPALLLLPFPAGFRFTCYYFRRAYYRSFVARPAACATEAWTGKDYKGEKGLMIFQNFHRYFLYATLLLWGLHVFNWVRDIFHGGNVYVGIGTVLLLIDIVLLGGYVLGCHAFRHLVGGRMDCFSCTAVNQTGHSVWSKVTLLNSKHSFYALASILSIVVADLYLRYIDMNGITTLWGLPA